MEEFDKNVEDNKKGDKKNSKAQSVKIKRQTPEVLIKGRNNNNTSADCNLQDYIPSCIKECFDCA